MVSVKKGSHASFFGGMLLRRRSRKVRIGWIVLVLGLSLSAVTALSNMYSLVSMNFRGETKARLLRGSTPERTVENPNHHCPDLPERLSKLENQQPAKEYILSKAEVEDQLKIMVPNHVGTTGNQVFLCPAVDNAASAPPRCRGVVKIYRWKHVYHHVKRCHKILEPYGIVPNILFADDESKLMVEENLGRTISTSLLPEDFEGQLRRLLCIFRKEKIIHRDLNWQNVVVNEETGKVYLIDLGDAFVWTTDGHRENYMLRNLINLFNIWWKGKLKSAHSEFLFCLLLLCTIVSMLYSHQCLSLNLILPYDGYQDTMKWHKLMSW